MLWLLPALRTLGVLGLAHLGLLGADPTQHIPPVANRIHQAIADGQRLENSGRFSAAIQQYHRAAELAQQSTDFKQEADAWLSITVLQLRQFDYSAARESSDRALSAAGKANDNALAGGATANLSTIYAQLGDFELAEQKARRSVTLLQSSSDRPFFVQALLALASVEILQGKTADGKQTSQQAINAAHQAGLASLEAMAWDYRGICLLRQSAASGDRGELAEAGEALGKAYEIRRRISDKDGLAISNEHLAELEIQKPQPDYGKALTFINEAFALPSNTFKATPQYYPRHIRALILQKQGRTAEALAQFRKAVQAADEWRRGALPGDATNTSTVVLLHDVYHDFAILAADESLARHDPALGREALEVLAENRAASLREQLTAAFGRKLKLPPRYFELLSQLQAAQANVTLGNDSNQERAKLNRIRLELSDFRNKIGIAEENFSDRNEKKAHKNSLRDIQARLNGDEALLSFCLGKEKSFVWAVTGDDVQLYKLSAESGIKTEAVNFTDAVRHGRDSSGPGRRLSQTLFQQLSPRVWQKREWLIAGDGALLDGVPFSNLPDLSSRQDQRFLMASHNLRFLPSELLLLASRAKAPEPAFVGIADPIYNSADARRSRVVGLVPAKETRESVALARLPGSEREVRSSADLSGMPESKVLIGAEATGRSLQSALAEDPAIVHFAVHVVSPPGQPEEAALALSLTQADAPELLTSEVIATYRVPGSLVVLSGCSSEQGKNLPSAGVVGLSRAWLLAGASAVVVSAWPTPDDSGRFFTAFYRHFKALKTGTLAQRAGAALQQAQTDVQQGGGYRSSPSFWAAYSIISKE
ncbi:MAG TPA: CHAT domain-containing protein [Bryobacteraceae bacterium]|nr:CHAT domain-containing protein [Bryobacteraceae bacterium]